MPHRDVAGSHLPKPTQPAETFQAVKDFLNKYDAVAKGQQQPPPPPMEPNIRVLTSELAEHMRAGREVHPALGIVGDLYAIGNVALVTAATAVQNVAWGSEEADKAHVRKLIERAENYHLQIIREQLSLLPIADPESTSTSGSGSVPEQQPQQRQQCHHHLVEGGIQMGHEPDDFCPVTKEQRSEYDGYVRRTMSKVGDALREMSRVLGDSDPTEPELEYVADACGISVEAIRDWFKRYHRKS